MTQDQSRYPERTNPSGFRPQRKISSESLTGQRGCWFCKVPGHRHQQCFEMRDWEETGRIHWSQDRTTLYLGGEDQGEARMINAYPVEGKSIKDNVLAAEAFQGRGEKGASVHTLRMERKGMQLLDESSDEEWDEGLEVYPNFEIDEADIVAARVESVKEMEFSILSPKTVGLMKKKVEFEK